MVCSLIVGRGLSLLSGLFELSVLLVCERLVCVRVVDEKFYDVCVCAWCSRSRATVANVIVRARRLRVTGVRRMPHGV